MNKYECTISQLPYHCGEEYGWGGDIIITIDIRGDDFSKPLVSLNLGSPAMGNTEPMRLARIIRGALYNYQETIDKER